MRFQPLAVSSLCLLALVTVVFAAGCGKDAPTAPGDPVRLEKPPTFVRQWGGYGSGAGQMNEPDGVVVSDSGRVYVADNLNYRMQRFTTDGVFVNAWGGLGTQPGEMYAPSDAAVDVDGRVYVADANNNRVQVFDVELKHRTTFGAALKLSGPKYLAFDGDRIWLADEYNHRVLLLDRAHQPLGVLGSGKRGRSAGEFHKPEAVLARAPYVWVIDTYNDRVVLLRVE